MMRVFTLFLFLFATTTSIAQQISFEQDSNTTATYEEVIAFYQALDEAHDSCSLLTYGTTDSGKPLHLFVINPDGKFTAADVHGAGKTVVLLNNGIHPGEPEGIDASMMLARDMLSQSNLPQNIVVCIIPVYNIGGMLNRGVSRANQNGPDAYGFRGNARNLDLNRDFIKTDSRNSRVFQSLFQEWQPDLFMDTHTSNGADYQYVMTLIDTHPDKLHPAWTEFSKEFTRELYARMETSGFGMIPYVYFRGRTPESGLVSFLETPRYSTGYAALHHTLGYLPETHMWKPYDQRVRSTYVILEHFLSMADEQASVLRHNRQQALERSAQQQYFTLTWNLDTSDYREIPFNGYESGEKPSEISGLPRQYYDRDQPYTRDIPFYHRYQPGVVVQKPAAYIIPQAWDEVVDLLELNGIRVSRLERDTTFTLDMYYITDYQTSRTPYEGHYMHSQTAVRTVTQSLPFYAGDYVVETNQPGNRYIVETLEPQATDSFFNWNFFDAILSQKEHFSPYIFEEEALRLLNDDPALEKEFLAARETDEELRRNSRAQLDWIYKRSPYYEKSHLRYPIGRLMTP